MLMTDNETIGIRVKALRAERGLTQQQLADSAHLVRQSVNNIEKARHTPDIQTIMKLAAALGVEPYELLKESG